MKNLNTQKRGSVKNLAISAALVVALAGGSFAMVGCGQSNEPAQQKETTTQQETKPETETQPAETEATTSWTTVASAEEAAKAAGLTLFGVPATFQLNDINYANPVFAQAGGVAQATYESPATQLVLRKGASGHTAAMSDRAATEFASTWQQDVDGISVTLLGAAQGQATVLTWTDGGSEYGVTWQGLGGDEMAMNEDQVATVVRAIHQANAASTQTTQQNQQQTTQGQKQNQQQNNQQNQNQQQNTQQNQQQSTQNQGESQQQTSQADSDMLSSDQAISIATGYVAGDNNVSGTSASLVTGGDAPHYVVSFHYDDADYSVTLDAYSGEIWSADQIFNDGTTYDFDPDEYNNDNDSDDVYDNDNDNDGVYDNDSDDVYDEDSQY